MFYSFYAQFSCSWFGASNSKGATTKNPARIGQDLWIRYSTLGIRVSSKNRYDLGISSQTNIKCGSEVEKAIRVLSNG
ncbi:hypothetical protein A2380_01525 [candidate division WWE3 bacterium RIFOXYB1_FULL_43_24]|nr:MAG: hypothetical protein A2380_01525 [candidate division WWE3 bacterium RIFOXYB1_FULL_43_24]OGC72392.1 MAG: hypothetical protein A2414_02495 [candidate division WWE3 bacterium RIFOXYC1_FULL_42_13]